MCRLGPRLISPHQKKIDTSGLIKQMMITYNGVNIVLNAYIAQQLFSSTLQFSWICEPVSYDNNPASLRVAAALWWYFVSKCFEFLDSFFFILRGKTKQLSFLHVYHHSSMFLLWWIGVKYVAGGSSIFGAYFNSVVHVFMYSYYLIAALGPKYKRYLGWKKYLTIGQMCQFVLAIIMGCNALRVQCDFPLWMQYAMIMYMISFLVLFGNFYANEYSKKRK